VAARPHSPLLEKALGMYIRISTSEPNPMAAEGQVLVLDNKTQAFRAPQLVEYCLSAVIAETRTEAAKEGKELA
jgi:hypothetical protein